MRFVLQHILRAGIFREEVPSGQDIFTTKITKDTKENKGR